MKSANFEKTDEIRLFRDRLTIALKAAKICVFEVDLVQQLYTFFENSEDIFGVSGDIILNDVRPFSKLDPETYRLAVSGYFSHPDDEEVISAAFRDIFSGKSTTYQARMRAGGSNFIWCKIDVTPVLEDGRPIKMIGVITDISHIKHQNDLLKEKASIDNFTGLYRKDYAIRLIRSFLSYHGHQSHILLLLDIDRFKNYNDTYGHFAGDKAIRAISERIRGIFRSDDICGRFGGDEFMILLKDFSDTDGLCEKLQPILRFQTDEHSLTASIGAAVYPQDAENFEELFQKADKALYHSKIQRNSLTFFSELDKK